MGAVHASRVDECVCTVELCGHTREAFGTLFRCSRVLLAPGTCMFPRFAAHHLTPPVRALRPGNPQTLVGGKTMIGVHASRRVSCVFLPL